MKSRGESDEINTFDGEIAMRPDACKQRDSPDKSPFIPYSTTCVKLVMNSL